MNFQEVSGMRILVVSDSHGRIDCFRRAILAQPKAEVVIFLGDGEREALELQRSFPEKMFLMVRGNCDWGSALPVENLFSHYEEPLGKVTVFYTHGHQYNVKSGDGYLRFAARDKKAQVALYGHTHTPLEDYEDGLHILNPGAVSNFESTYGVVDITPRGIVTSVLHLV